MLAGKARAEVGTALQPLKGWPGSHLMLGLIETLGQLSHAHGYPQSPSQGLAFSCHSGCFVLAFRYAFGVGARAHACVSVTVHLDTHVCTCVCMGRNPQFGAWAGTSEQPTVDCDV